MPTGVVMHPAGTDVSGAGGAVVSPANPVDMSTATFMQVFLCGHTFVYFKRWVDELKAISLFAKVRWHVAERGSCRLRMMTWCDPVPSLSPSSCKMMDIEQAAMEGDNVWLTSSTPRGAAFDWMVTNVQAFKLIMPATAATPPPSAGGASAGLHHRCLTVFLRSVRVSNALTHLPLSVAADLVPGASTVGRGPLPRSAPAGGGATGGKDAALHGGGAGPHHRRMASALSPPSLWPSATVGPTTATATASGSIVSPASAMHARRASADVAAISMRAGGTAMVGAAGLRSPLAAAGGGTASGGGLRVQSHRGRAPTASGDLSAIIDAARAAEGLGDGSIGEGPVLGAAAHSAAGRVAVLAPLEKLSVEAQGVEVVLIEPVPLRDADAASPGAAPPDIVQLDRWSRRWVTAPALMPVADASDPWAGHYAYQAHYAATQDVDGLTAGDGTSTAPSPVELGWNPHPGMVAPPATFISPFTSTAGTPATLSLPPPALRQTAVLRQGVMTASVASPVGSLYRLLCPVQTAMEVTVHDMQGFAAAVAQTNLLQDIAKFNAKEPSSLVHLHPDVVGETALVANGE